MKAAHADLFTDFYESLSKHALSFAHSAHDLLADNEKTDVTIYCGWCSPTIVAPCLKGPAI